MNIVPFASVVKEFVLTAHTQVWCSVATVDSLNRPRTRILHPIWEADDTHAAGWLFTNRDSLKANHLQHSPYMSLGYVKDPIKPVVVECHAEWVDSADEKQRIWDWFKGEPAPLGYDPGTIWRGGVSDPKLGLIKLTPWFIRLGDMIKPEFRSWKADGDH